MQRNFAMDLLNRGKNSACNHQSVIMFVINMIL